MLDGDALLLGRHFHLGKDVRGALLLGMAWGIELVAYKVEELRSHIEVLVDVDVLVRTIDWHCRILLIAGVVNLLT